MTPDVLSRLSLEIHGAAERYDLSGFHDYTLQCIRNAIPHDYAMWGLFAVVDGLPEAYHVHCYGHSSYIMHDLYTKEAFAEDFVAQQSIANPGRTFTGDIKDVPAEHTGLLGWLHRWDIGHAMGTQMLIDQAGLMHILVLHRRLRAAPFTEEERRFKETLMPHIVETTRRCIQFEVQRTVLGEWEAKHCTAITDARGVLHDAEDRFLAALESEWPGWRGAKLPAPLVELLGADEPWIYRGKEIDVRGTTLGTRRLLVAGTPNPLNQLSPREREIARHFADGATHGEIGEQLSIAPTTVRNHIANIYRKLGIGNKIALCELLRSGV
ncbi:MAG: helix-turn-helix transcriptional regulator [Rhodocyclaceae bacterium]|nr:helix-turn-helix transcriptional regulator [Rhodocyclaceae bacterium]